KVRPVGPGPARALAAEPGEAMPHVGGVADLALLAVADDVDARVELLAHDVGHGPADAGLEGGGIRRVPGVQRLQHRGQIRRTGQAAFRASLHRAGLLPCYFTDARKAPSALLKASGCSMLARCAAFGRISRREPAMRSC